MSKTSFRSELVSIIIPFHKESEFLTDCLESVRDQSYSQYECILIDNGADPNAIKVAKKFCSSDDRFHLVDAAGMSFPSALNLGMKIARGSLIARMDSDDVMLKHRITAQVNEFISNPKLAICGGNVERFGAIEGLIRYPLDDLEIKSALMFKCAFSHPAVMFNRDRFDQTNSNELKYDLRYKVSEDYDLYLRSMQVGVYKNIPQVLIKYRVHCNQLTQLKSKSVENYSNSARIKFIRENGGSYLFARLHNLVLAGFPFGKILLEYRKKHVIRVLSKSIVSPENRIRIEIEVGRLVDQYTTSLNTKNLFRYLARKLAKKLLP
jgi:glycosyltransferase involved in cell wall biosynthesis